ncbi:ATP-dependent DNA helicase RecG [Ligilactobacillus ceti]|nr:ATP-dependent DNA helicase RecG [Ligilactobacillus ceti]
MLKLSDSIGVLKGVGPKKITAFNKLGINTIADLLTYYPFRYDDIREKKISEIADQEKVTLKGKISTLPVLTRFGRYKSRLNFKLLVDHDIVNVTFFNQPYLMKNMEIGQELAVYGKYDLARQSLTGIKILTQQATDDFVGVYRASKELNAAKIKKVIDQAYQTYQGVITDLIPETLRQKYQLLPRAVMIRDLHFPNSPAQNDLARRTAIFEEFFLFQAGLQSLKQKERTQTGRLIAYDNQVLKQFIASLPFELTGAQKRVVNEICYDLHHPIHMNRLLQGDVGSGKTIVAAIAMYAAKTAGLQSALMVPTEILAQQHAEKLVEIFADFDVNVALLTSTTAKKAKQRRTLLENLANGEIDIVVGTQALIQDPVIFHDLGLVVIDEQHRFGVQQRQILRNKGDRPDLLAMTATPIPRTLAITAYGEMDVSVINELPKGRKPIQTSLYSKKQFSQALNFMQAELKKGTQAYVISPLIAESEMLDLQNAQDVYENLKKHFAGQYQVGILHGQMPAEEKDAVMQAFKDHQLDILVSTTVIEVGVDVPNATVMLILDADRFGLAQLHQLRGRVGRGQQSSYCILVADPKSEYGKARMQTMVMTNDGFVIAQKDLELRGPGDVLGRKQSGIPDFRIGDPVKDLAILQVAQQEAQQLVKEADFYENPAYQALVKYLQENIITTQNFD